MKRVNYWTIKHTRLVGLEVGRKFMDNLSSAWGLTSSMVFLSFSDAELDGWYPESEIILRGQVPVTSNSFVKSRS